MRRFALAVLVAVGALMTPAIASAKAKPLPPCRVRVPGVVETCLSPERVLYAESQFPDALAPPQAVVRSVTRMRLGQVILIRAKGQISQRAIYYVFGHPSMAHHPATRPYVVIKEFASGASVSRQTGGGAWDFSAILPPSNVLLDIRSNLPLTVVQRIGKQLLDHSTGLMRVELKVIDPSIPLEEGLSIWRAWGNPNITRAHAIQIGLGEANSSSLHGHAQLIQVFLARVIGTPENINSLAWYVSAQTRSGKNWTFMFVDAYSGDLVGGITGG